MRLPTNNIINIMYLIMIIMSSCIIFRSLHLLKAKHALDFSSRVAFKTRKGTKKGIGKKIKFFSYPLALRSGFTPKYSKLVIRVNFALELGPSFIIIPPVT